MEKQKKKSREFILFGISLQPTRHYLTISLGSILVRKQHDEARDTEYSLLGLVDLQR